MKSEHLAENNWDSTRSIMVGIINNAKKNLTSDPNEITRSVIDQNNN